IRDRIGRCLVGSEMCIRDRVNTFATNDQGLVQNLGQLLFTKYVLPFEVSSVLFIAAMVGAVLLAKREKQIID
ncbi:MAG: NADH-quinone oxidoreductase subunit J, partial [Flavobacteriia bacterium]